MRRSSTALVYCAVAFAAPPPKDLDIGIPPGSPVSWARRFPSITPRNGPLFPITPGKAPVVPGAPGGQKADPTKTVGQTRTAKLDVRIASQLGVVRILTWDILAHLPWLSQAPKTGRGPVTGARAGLDDLPPVEDPLYWASMASLLRLMLHPQLVSEDALLAHLCEIGEPALAVLGVAASERSLAPVCDRLARMIPAPRTAPRPLAGATPRETMLERFVADELVAVHPFDPSAGFGHRIMLLAEEVEPFLIRYTKHPDSFLRRNAVAALGRYRTDTAMTALAGLVQHTKDSVVLMRALGALSGYRSLRQREGLLARLESTKDGVEKVALVAALGGTGAREAVPALLDLLSKRRDPDVLMAVLEALARIQPRGDARALAFARRTLRSARSQPARFAVSSRGGPAADVPDDVRTRGKVIEQLALILRARLDPTDGDAGAQLVALVPSEEKAKTVRGGRGTFRNQSIHAVTPPAQILFLETLRGLGEPGVAALQRVVADKTVEPALRGTALAQLPFTERAKAAVAILDANDGHEAQVYALEVLDNDGHDQLEEIARKLLATCKRSKPGAARPDQRYLWLQALRALDRRSLLKTADLLPLLPHARVHGASRDGAHRRVRDLVIELVDAAAANPAHRAVRDRVDALVQLVIEAAVNPRITEAQRAEARREVLQRLVGLRGHKADARYKAQVTQEVLHYLLGFKMGISLRDRIEFRPVVPLEREVLFALGRTATAEAAAALVEFLEEHPASPLRADACLGLGMTGSREHAKALLGPLGGDDGFARFCAYEALRHLTGADHFADWLYGEPATRAAALEQYRALLEK